MTPAPVLDTHAWIWWLDRDSRLGHSTIAALDALPVDARPVLCDISLWEVAMLVERKRLSFSLPFAEWLQAAAHPRTVRLQPISPEIALAVSRLPVSFRRDPADRVIVASCRVLGAPVVTRDRLISASRLVKPWRPASAPPRA
jgi:PIN domain nuclease of toxin-antitoxin system